ncbi:MAG: ATP-binding protein [Bacilli bacterium]|nr:ATP-binding protein [Bacilli bacterium]
MKRKIYDELVKWKEKSNGKTALLIDGARRVGKSYIVEEFARKNYKSYILLDFNKVPEDIKKLFDLYLDDLDNLFLYLETYYNVTLYNRDSLIIFDEVQLYPRARSAIKYLVADGRYDYIETGSLVSIRNNVDNILIPSEEQHLKMYPMDFEEFLWAMNNGNMMELIKKCFDTKKPLGESLHRKAMDCFRQYMIVGGMPQAVFEYVETKDFNKVDQIKRNILNLYRDDIKKHAGKYSLKVESIFDSIPSQLSRHEKKYRITSLDKDAKSRDYEHAFVWLNDAMIINYCFNTTEPSIGLSLNTDNSTLKCYMADTGLLISHSFSEKGLVSEEVYKKILFDKLEYNGGMIIENIVSQMLVANGHKLFFYSNSSRDNSLDRMEIDFLITKSNITNRHNISPIEVKSGKNYTLVSLNKFRKKYQEQLGVAYIIHTGDLKEEDGVIYLPLYMTMLL